MRTKLPVLIAFCLFFLILGLWFYSSSQASSPDIAPIVIQEQQQENKQETPQEWFYVMADGKSKTFEYPVSEMGLKYESDRDIEPMRVFIDDLNEYRFYCINQILLDNKIEYAYYKTNSIIRLVVFLNDPTTQKKILEDFDYYKIQYVMK